MEKGKVERQLAHQPEAQKLQKVASDVVRVQKALHQQETEDGERQPSDEPQHKIQRYKGGGGCCVIGIAAFDAGSADVINEHGDAGDVLECRAAEPEAGGGADGLGHRGSLFSKDMSSCGNKNKKRFCGGYGAPAKNPAILGQNAPEWRKNRTKMLDKGRAG